MKKSMNAKMDYNYFHRKTSVQTKTIGKKNYTYRFLVETLNKYKYKDKEILDIGCGSGAIDFYLARNASYVLGIDISENAIKKCKESSRLLGLQNNTLFKVVDFPRNFIKQKFDIIICSEVLEHLKEDELAIKQIKKMLKNNGIAIISVPSKNAPLYKWGFASDFDRGVGHLRRYSINDLSSLLKNAGLTIVEVRKIEGLLRNFLFLNRNAGKLIKFLKSYLSDITTMLDKALILLFGESNILIVAKNKKS